jgi:hypothetical protein
MATDEAARRSVNASIDSATGSSVTLDKEVLVRALGTPSQGALDKAFGWLVPGLIVMLLLSLVGMFLLIYDANVNTAPDMLLTAFTALLTGLLGLFIKSPQQ